MTDINSIAKQLSLFSVFTDVLKRPVFRAFASYCRSSSEGKPSAYARFVRTIYLDGGNLTATVRRAVFEDENVYVKAIGNMMSVNANIAAAVSHELDVLSAFASLTAADFAADMNETGYLPAFDSESADIRSEYDKRVDDISKYGYGVFASNAMFSVDEYGNILPIASADRISLDKFIGYREERQRVIDNTTAFIAGRPAANVLLYGDAGTGKSSTVKAIVNHFFDDGLRLIELRKNQLLLLPKVMGEISENPLRFIIFIDDLSFNQNDDSFSMLKATLEGSACARAKNAVIYATSNRRHIVKESFSDRDGDDVHRNDTVQETLSLSERFGLTVLFAKPEKKLYLEIIHELADRFGIKMDAAELDTKAEAFALKRGYRSARCAEQFIESLL